MKISVVEIIFSTVAGGNTVTLLITGLPQGFFSMEFSEIFRTAISRTHLHTLLSLLYHDKISQ